MMKRLLGILLMMGGGVISSQAQKISSAKVPAPVKAAFEKAHAKTSVKWEMEKSNYEAGFTLNGKETSEVYTAAGSLLETETAIRTNELPAAVLARLKGKKIAEAAKITRADGTVCYEAEVKGKDFLFDTEGNAVKH